jgi:pilus assembly protein CpaB
VLKGEASSPKGRAEMETTLGLPVYVIPSEDQRPRLVCQTIVQDAIVLGVGDFENPETVMKSQQPAQAVDAQSPLAVNQQAQQPTPIPTPATPRYITLVVSPQDAVTLNYSLLAGVKLNLSLRNPTDTTPFLTDAVTQQYLMDQKGIPLPAKLPYSLAPRVDVLNFPDPEPVEAPVPQQ